MKYSVILPCFNEAHTMPLTLVALNRAKGDRQDIECIIVDNGSTDDSVQLAHHFGARVLTCNRETISTVRNVGARNSHGAYLYFLDCDIAVPEHLFVALDAFIAENKYDVLGFVDLAPETAPWFARTWSLRSLARRQKYMPVHWLPGRNIFLSRDYFNRVNGFDVRLKTSEDKDFVFRLRQAGATVVSDPRLILIHLGFERTFSEWCRKEFWRQHSHFNLLISQGPQLRLLRFPALAGMHLALFSSFVFALISGHLPGWLPVLLWLTPSLVQTLAFRTSRLSGHRIPQFFVLFFLRFHIAGLAMLHELYELWCARRNNP